VEIFHKWTMIGAEIDRYSIGVIMKRLEQGGVTIHNGLELAGVNESTLDFVSTYTTAHQEFEGFDSVVLVYGSAPDTRLYDQLKGKVSQLYLVGSAWVPRGMHEATEHGMKVGLAI